jgi:hypothetical protein
MFTVIFATNLIAFVTFVATSKGQPLRDNVQNACSANIMMCILFRQENVVNAVYEIFTAVPHKFPLWIRSKCAKVFHYGGVHSGCGVAAVVWFVLYTALSTRAFVQNPSKDDMNDVITCYLLIAMFLFILICAHPKIRVKFHDYFEAIHRFAGWSALCILWVHTFLSATASARSSSPKGSLGHSLIIHPSFWFLTISSCCTILSWSRLRHYPVFPEVLSDHAIRLHFKHKPMKPFYGIKISDKPLFEWHAFATIPDMHPDESGQITGFSVVVSNAGDWTNKVIKNTPEKLYIRGYPLHGLLYTTRLFKKIVLVATGSGIGPCLSLMISKEVNARILWSTPNPSTTYKQGIIDEVKSADPNAMIWNTREKGRPDMVALTWSLLNECGAEAVYVISNPKVTKKIVYGMESRGIPAYGAIFDS